MKKLFKLTNITKVLICAFLFVITITPNNVFAVTNTKKVSVIGRYLEEAKNNKDFCIDFAVTPYVFRHSKAMHLLQAGVNLIYIRDFLGHSNIGTTEIYARADTEMKRKALEQSYIELTTEDLPKWQK